MKIDSYKTLVREQNSYPGSIGDSCCDTSEYAHLKAMLDESSDEVDLHAFVTPKGFLRHPTAPEKDENGDSWREDDFTTDQGLPLFLASVAKRDFALPISIYMRIKEAGWRTGNGDLVSLSFFAALSAKQWLINLCTVGQVLLFQLPWRWSDSKRQIESSTTSSSDYLSWFHLALHAHPLCRRLISKKTLKAKVQVYYAPEPNNEMIVLLYDRVIDKYW